MFGHFLLKQPCPQEEVFEEHGLTMPLFINHLYPVPSLSETKFTIEIFNMIS